MARSHGQSPDLESVSCPAPPIAYGFLWGAYPKRNVLHVMKAAKNVIFKTSHRNKFALRTFRSLLTGISLFLVGCNPGYLVRGAYEQSKILINREDIPKLLAQPLDKAPDADTRAKLSLVQDALAFGGSEMGLNVGKAYRTYSATERDPLAWIVLAAPSDSLTPYTWWFPIVGSVPYKGYFTKEGAQAEASRLEALGYETWVRGTSAFSTLGWFEDPVVTPMLKAEPHSLVNTILHECFHRTLWIPGNVSYNERLATFVGLQGALDFYRHQAESDPSFQPQVIKAKDTLKFYEDLSEVFTPLVADLKELFARPLSRQEKILKRTEIYQMHLAPLKARYPNFSILKTPNNAELMQHALYLVNLAEFRDAFEGCEHAWACFLEQVKPAKK